jgi:lipopolysaccharide transport system ATP-binding protein
MFGLRRPGARRRALKDPARLGPRVALWGTFDLPDYGNLLLPRIFERELRKRLPLAQVVAYSPLGYDHPLAMDGGRPALPFGSADPRRKRQLAEQHDLVVVVGDVIHTHDELHAERYGIRHEDTEHVRPSRFFVDGLGAELAQRCPVVWHAVEVPFDLDPAEAERIKNALESIQHVSARDPTSRERLEQTGTTREIGLVPDPTILVSRLFDSEVLRKRRDYLRVIDSYPAHRPPIVVQGDASLVEQAADIARALTEAREPSDEIVLAELSQTNGDAVFADAIAAHLPGASRLPAIASLEDITAAIAHARLFVGTSARGRSAALAFGVPTASLASDSALDLVASAEELSPAALHNEVDAAFDELAAIAEDSWSARAAADGRTLAELAQALSHAIERYEILLRAHDARGKRLVTERLKFAEIVDRLEAACGELSEEAAHRIAELENAIFVAQAAEAEARYELEQIRNEREPGG